MYIYICNECIEWMYPVRRIRNSFNIADIPEMTTPTKNCVNGYPKEGYFRKSSPIMPYQKKNRFLFAIFWYSNLYGNLFVLQS